MSITDLSRLSLGARGEANNICNKLLSIKDLRGVFFMDSTLKMWEIVIFCINKHMKRIM